MFPNLIVYVVQANLWYVGRCSKEVGTEHRSCVAICDRARLLRCVLTVSKSAYYLHHVRHSFCPHVSTRPTVRIAVEFDILVTVKICK